jgi:hypothetical protein
MKTVLIKTTDEQGVMYSLSGENLPENYVLSLKNCQAIENGYNLDELTIKFMDEFREGKEFHTNQMLMPLGFNKGFQKALEILGDKKFSEDDMLKAYNQGGNDGASYESFCGDHDSYEQMEEAQQESEQNEKEFIQSLQQTEWNVEIEMEDKLLGLSLINPIPKLDADGYLILKRK